MRRRQVLLPSAAAPAVLALALAASADVIAPDNPTDPWLPVDDGAFVGAHEIYWGGFHVGSVESET